MGDRFITGDAHWPKAAATAGAGLPIAAWKLPPCCRTTQITKGKNGSDCTNDLIVSLTPQGVQSDPRQATGTPGNTWRSP